MTINWNRERETLPDGVTPSPFIVNRYVECVLAYEDYVLSHDYEIILNFVDPAEAIPVDEEVFASIILPIVEKRSNFIILLVMRGLTNPYCPANVLSAACRSSQREYRRLASEHPNCPEGDAVYATLVNGMNP